MDSCAGADLISEKFAISQGLKPIAAHCPRLTVVGKTTLKTYHNWLVPLIMQDCRGCTQSFTQICIGVDGDPNVGGIPILLSATILVD